MAVAGASYGGYMVNWMNGRTTRFKAIVSHGGAPRPSPAGPAEPKSNGSRSGK